MHAAPSLILPTPDIRPVQWAVQLAHVHKSYGSLTPRPALTDVSLQIERGSCYGLAGPNGAGKTTLIKVMLGLILPDAGEVRLLGHPADSPEVRRKIGFVPEAANLPPGETPLGLVKRWARLRGMNTKQALREGEQHLVRLGMQEFLKRPAHRFSKGERQRTLLALALLGGPDLLVLDEPTDGLDPLGRALMRRVIQEECAAGRTVFLNSHLLSETERLCHRVGILHRGRIVREVELDPEAEPRKEHGTSVITLHEPLSETVARELSLREAEAPGSYVIEHTDVRELNAALDHVRARGGMLTELRRVQTNLEDTLTLIATGASTEPHTQAPVELDEPEPLPNPPARTPRAIGRIAREIFSDLVARKIAWVALAGVLVIFALATALVNNHVLIGAAAGVNALGDGGMLTKGTASLWLGGTTAESLYWALLFCGSFLSALFAPPLLSVKRHMLLLAQPVSRSDVALGIFTSVCGFALCLATLAYALIFGVCYWLNVPVSPLFLAAPLMTTLSFAALYAGMLCVTYLLPNGLFAGIFGVGQLIFFTALGESSWAKPSTATAFQSFVTGLIPKLTPLGNQAEHLGRGEPVSWFPVVTTLLYTVAVVLLLQVIARRSER